MKLGELKIFEDLRAAAGQPPPRPQKWPSWLSNAMTKACYILFSRYCFFCFDTAAESAIVAQLAQQCESPKPAISLYLFTFGLPGAAVRRGGADEPPAAFRGRGLTPCAAMQARLSYLRLRFLAAQAEAGRPEALAKPATAVGFLLQSEQGCIRARRKKVGDMTIPLNSYSRTHRRTGVWHALLPKAKSQRRLVLQQSGVPIEKSELRCSFMCSMRRRPALSMKSR